MYGRKSDRENYAAFLCREFPSINGNATQSIVFELHYQKINPRPVAVEQNDVHSVDSFSKMLDDFPCNPKINL